MWLFAILAILFVAAVIGGGWGHSRGVYWGWSPAVVILAVVAVAYLTGHLAWHG